MYSTRFHEKFLRVETIAKVVILQKKETVLLLSFCKMFQFEPTTDEASQGDSLTQDYELGLPRMDDDGSTAAEPEKFDMDPADAKDEISKGRLIMTVVAKRLRLLHLSGLVLEILAFALLAALSLLPEGSHYWICAVGTEAVLRIVPLLVLLAGTVFHIYQLYKRFSKRKALRVVIRDLSIASAFRLLLCLLVATIKIKAEVTPSPAECETRVGMAAVWAICIVLTMLFYGYMAMTGQVALQKNTTVAAWIWSEPQKWDQECVQKFFDTPHMVM
jgi:hypothetical protein